MAGFIRQYCVAPQVGSTVANASNSVWTYENASGAPVYNLFTEKGKYYVKILNALGYPMPADFSQQTGSLWMSGQAATPTTPAIGALKDIKYNAMPLLAFFKAYNDYMSQSQRYNISALSSLLKSIKHNTAVASQYSNGHLFEQGINVLFSNLFLNYENDYFTSAWQSANSPIGNFRSTDI